MLFTSIAFLTGAAQTIVRPGQLAGILVEELRRNRVALSTPLVLEAVIRGARVRAERLAHEVLTADLSADTLAGLDTLLEKRAPPGKLSWLGWLRGAPEAPKPRSVGKLIDRVEHVRSFGIDRAREATLPTRVFERLAVEAEQLTVQHLGELNPLRRHATLAAAAIALEATLTDACLAMFEKLMAGLGRSADKRADEKAAASAREMQGYLRTLGIAGRALIDAQKEGTDILVAVQKKVDWTRFVAAVTEAERIARPGTLDRTAELIARYATVRLFGPALLSAFAFEGSGAVKDLIEALTLIRDLHATGKRKLPPTPPLRFVPRSWRAFVIKDGTVDRPAYELCAFSELRDRLRAVTSGLRDRVATERSTTICCRLRRSPRFAPPDRCRSRSSLAGTTTSQTGRGSSKKRSPRSPGSPGQARCPMCVWTRRGCRSRRCARRHRPRSSRRAARSTTACRVRASPRCCSTSTRGRAFPNASRTSAAAASLTIQWRCSPASSPTASILASPA